MVFVSVVRIYCKPELENLPVRGPNYGPSYAGLTVQRDRYIQ